MRTKGGKALDEVERECHVPFSAKSSTQNLCEKKSGAGPRGTLENPSGISGLVIRIHGQ